MDEQHGRYAEDDADDLLRRALIDPEASVAVALKVNGLALADALTVVFHGRADLGTIQTYVAHGPAPPAPRSPRTSSSASRATSTSATPRAATRPRRRTSSRRARSATRSSPPTPSSRSGRRRSPTWPRARSRSRARSTSASGCPRTG